MIEVVLLIVVGIMITAHGILSLHEARRRTDTLEAINNALERIAVRLENDAKLTD